MRKLAQRRLQRIRSLRLCRPKPTWLEQEGDEYKENGLNRNDTEGKGGCPRSGRKRDQRKGERGISVNGETETGPKRGK